MKEWVSPQSQENMLWDLHDYDWVLLDALGNIHYRCREIQPDWWVTGYMSHKGWVDGDVIMSLDQAQQWCEDRLQEFFGKILYLYR